MQLICKQRGATSDGDGAEYFTALIDITERRRLEGERTKAAREHAALARRLLSVQDEERQRIARDLHDNIGQQVTSLRLMLDLIAMASIDDGVRARVTQSQSIVEQLDRQLDFITGELRPASLDLGMTAAIRQFVDEWAATFGIVAEFRGEGTEELRLKPEAETHLYRVVQEALNNVYKHARATRVSVSLECKGHEVFLVVEDDGHGFDAAGLADSQNRGLGLVGMRERAQIVGGSIDIQSRAARRGTRISVRVPVD